MKNEVNKSECMKPCVGPWGEVCGGEDRIHVYDLKSKRLIHNITLIIIYADTLIQFFVQSTGNIKHSYTHESIKLQEEFNALNLKSLWDHEIYIPQEPVCNKNLK